MTRSVLPAALLASLVLAACGGDDDGGGSSGTPAKPGKEKVTITFWNPFSAKREVGIANGLVADFERKHPNIDVEVRNSINDDKITAAIRGGNPPDVVFSFTTDNVGAFCSSGAFQDLNPYIKRDRVDLNQLPKAVQEYTAYEDKRCVMPVLADVLGLYYNKELFRKAGVSEPPKTISELTAAAKKLTQRGGDGSLEVVGYTPFIGFYENVPAHYAPVFGAQWVDGEGKSSLATSPGWSRLATWVKSLVDWYGKDRLVRFQAGAGDEYSASNAFQKGKVAMMIDGEYRTAFIADEAPDLEYGTAPLPADDAHPELHGGGFVTGNIIGIPKGAEHPAEAWELIKFLATDVGAQVKFANGLKNVPSWKPALDSPELDVPPQFKTFLEIFEHPATRRLPVTPVGRTNQDLLEAFLEKYQAGSVDDLRAGLAGLDKQIDARAAQAGSDVP